MALGTEGSRVIRPAWARCGAGEEGGGGKKKRRRGPKPGYALEEQFQRRMAAIAEAMRPGPLFEARWGRGAFYLSDSKTLVFTGP
jgi:hypothetical protein